MSARLSHAHWSVSKEEKWWLVVVVCAPQARGEMGVNPTQNQGSKYPFICLTFTLCWPAMGKWWSVVVVCALQGRDWHSGGPTHPGSVRLITI